MDYIVKYRCLIGHICGIGSVLGYFIFTYKTNGFVSALIIAPLIYIAGHMIVLKWHIITNAMSNKKIPLTKQFANMDMGTFILKSGLVIMATIGYVAWKLYQQVWAKVLDNFIGQLSNAHNRDGDCVTFGKHFSVFQTAPAGESSGGEEFAGVEVFAPRDVGEGLAEGIA